MRRIEIKRRDDIRGERVRQDIEDLGLSSGKVDVLDVYLIYGDITNEEFLRIVEVVTDPVSEEWGVFKFAKNTKIIEVALNPGVMDPVAIDTLDVIEKIGIEIDGVKPLKKYVFYDTDDKTINLAKERVLLNPLIQHIVMGKETLKMVKPGKKETPTVNVSSLTEKELLDLSKSMGLFLNEEEMKDISHYFSKEWRAPTVAEIETFGILWSEHCSHKTMRGDIKIKNQKSKIKNLLKSTIMKVTEELDKPWVISAFKDNAGIVEFNDEYAICFKVETHNHPSALEPFGGAATGIGGVVRDILGCGLGAKPIANIDVFCVGDPDTSYSSLPEGVLHPRRILRGIVSGVGDYGNKLGIPTVNGSVTYHKDYTANPLVYCGCVGIIPKANCQKKVNTNDLIILVGGRTGRDGIHGATFSSGVMDENTQREFSSAVQIGDPLREKNLLDAILFARDKELYSSITDCGAGGICTAVSELAEGIGAEVQLENVPLKYKGLSPTEIWISESQERMVLSAPEEKLDELKKIFDECESELTVIGRFVKTGRIVVSYRKEKICDIDLAFLLHGMPKTAKTAIIPVTIGNREEVPENLDIESIFESMLSHPNIASKEWIVRQYDHEVQGGTIIKPLLADAAVIKPLSIRGDKGIIIGHGLAPFYKDVYKNASSSLDEAVRNLCAVGGDPSHIALLDNFSWGSPEDPVNIGKLVRACKALYNVASAYKMPFISGKDSLYNEFESDGEKQSVLPTILISGIGFIKDVKKGITQSIKVPGAPIYIIGRTYSELGSSLLYRILKIQNGEEPSLHPQEAIELYRKLHIAIKKGVIFSCHDCSEGGIGIAVSEMCFGTGLGIKLSLDNVPVSDVKNPFSILFSESNSRFIVEVSREREKEFEEIMSEMPFGKVGEVIPSRNLVIENLINIPVERLENVWKSRGL
ncbi:MAG: phosphoribosylformylglycinamidine synthase subunit PurL [bacterium]|nr:phosphoribosylformylglycinamidine synthase subunit PurL [bacterium]